MDNNIYIEIQIGYFLQGMLIFFSKTEQNYIVHQFINVYSKKKNIKHFCIPELK